MTVSVLNTASKVQGSATDNVGKAQPGNEVDSSFQEQMNDIQEKQESAEELETGTALEKRAGLINDHDRQFFADLLGATLPQINENMQAQELDLDETLSVLEDVLAHLPPDRVTVKSQLLNQEKMAQDRKFFSSGLGLNDVLGEGLKNQFGSEAGSEKLTAKLADLQHTTIQSMGEQTSAKIITADLTGLNRQIENLTARHELPVMTKPFNHPEWQQEFNDRILWMHKKAIPSAELRLNPNHLGPVSIRIRVDQEQQTSIIFSAKHAQVSEVIEAAIPRLREMLHTQQVNLVEVNVSSQQRGNSSETMQERLDDSHGGNKVAGLMSEETNEVNDLAEDINQGSVVTSKGLLNLYV